jgi:hypothetical protein
MIVSMIALCFALVGTAFAQDPVAKITKAKVKAVAKKQINKAAPGLSVAKAVDADKAKLADKATIADTATKANTATTATTAATIAYGMFDADGTIADPDRVKNLANANVTHVPASGVYCFEGLGFAAKNAMATGDNGFGALDTMASVRIATPSGGVLGGCPAAATVRVDTFDISLATLADRAFLVSFQD